MKQVQTYPILLKTIALAVFMGYFCLNAALCYYEITDSQLLSFELCDPMDAESEQEEKNMEEEIDDKFPADFHRPSLFVLDSLVHLLHKADSYSFHHPEIVTPPPESGFFLS